MTLQTTKEIWDFLKQEYEGDERVRGMKALNFFREFEFLGIVNNVRLLGTNLSYSRIIQKLLIIIFERFETTISSLENMKDLSTITLAELLNVLQVQEQM
ncbi:Retrovirus-related Pol polyprotein from transposon TNT 1-94 [Gossypium australe]|uniref:Retrovirus-related Pol polyprotein from transposon TNT 1-94 n=1 Tax=Gossypium australe TaxID=47621 RepID=A0A5B6X2S8_9ROSI|nr:Retrovirus-related Pol polyprotein from transposon TNT 1-94 [Gossypium australe]